MRTAVVVGAGGAGREIAAWYRASRPHAEILGFVDDNPARERPCGDLAVLGELAWLTDHEVDDVVIGVGAPAARRRVTRELTVMGVTPASVVHPTAIVGERVTIGAGAVVSPGVILTVDVSVGVSAYLNYGAAVGHDTTIGDFAVLAPGASIAGNVTIAAGVDFGIGASIIQGLHVGEGAVIGGGACVTRDIPARHVAVGVPAKTIREHDRW